MGRPGDLGRGPLIARRRGDVPPPPAPTDDGEWAGRPCWVQLEPGEQPGQVYAWRKSATGEAWEGLLVAWVPADSVRPR